MYYFDNKTLAQYIDQNVKLKVYANDDWYEIADKRDLYDPIDCVGYDEFGGDHRFNYTDIGQIKVGDRIFTVDQLQSQKTGKPSDTAEKPKPKGGDEPDLGSEEEPASKKEKEPELSHFSPVFDVGRDLLRELELMRKPKRD